MPSPVLVLLASLVTICSALQPQEPYQAGSPLNKDFVPGRSLVVASAFHISEVLGELESVGLELKRDLGSRACGSNQLASCPDNLTTCCDIGGQCCSGGASCCSSGRVCQTSAQGATVCCVQGSDCTNTIPDNPCKDQATVPCLGYDFCCPKGNTCSVVGWKQLCRPIASGAGGLVPRQDSSSVMPTSKSTSTPTPTLKSVSTSTPTSKSASTPTPMSTSTPTSEPTSTPTSKTSTVQNEPTSDLVITVITTATPQPPSVITTTLTSTSSGVIVTPQTDPVTTPMETSNSVTLRPSTVVEYTTIISSYEVSSGVYASTNLVIYTTRVFTPVPADSTSTGASSPVPSSNRSKGTQVAIIAGASVGGTLFLVAIGFLIFFCARRRREVEEPVPEFIPAPVREPTVPVLPQRLGDNYRGVPTRPISELSSASPPVSRYNSMYNSSHVQAPAYNDQPMAEMHAEAYRQPQEMSAQKYEYPVATYELPSPKHPPQHPYGGPGGQGYGHGY